MENDLQAVENTGEIVPAQGLLNVASLMPQARVNRRDSIRSVEEAIAIVTVDEDAAKECFYALPRAGKMIEGPSVGLAETLASTWGNLMVSIDEVDIGEREITVKGSAIDLQSGMGYQSFARRRIVDKNGKRYNEDMINTTLMAAQKILYRNLVFTLIPRPLVRKVYNAARNVALGDGDTFLVRVDNAFKYWLEQGVEEGTLMRHIGVTKRSQVNLAHLEYLIGISQAVRDGAASIQDVFSRKRDSEEDPPQVAPPEDLKAATAKLKAEAEKKPSRVDDPVSTPASDPMFKPTPSAEPSPPPSTDPPSKPDGEKPAAKKPAKPRKPSKNRVIADIEALLIAQGKKNDTGFDHQGAYTEIVADMLEAEGLYEPGEDIDINKLSPARLGGVLRELEQQIAAHEKEVTEHPKNYPGSPKPPEQEQQEL